MPFENSLMTYLLCIKFEFWDLLGDFLKRNSAERTKKKKSHEDADEYKSEQEIGLNEASGKWLK